MKLSAKLFLFISLIILSGSCKKNQTGGKSTLKGTVKHHNKPIPDAYVYIKFNSSEFPGKEYTSYDTYVQADSYGNYSISFFKGTYYIFAVGRDLDVPPPYEVSGGLSITVKNKENLIRDIAVTED
ncbi:MAG: hypothetical protein H7141_14415 [Burkholderiales bacterium]|nr:hypothetical protein [Bacteroidia bacterium]